MSNVLVPYSGRSVKLSKPSLHSEAYQHASLEGYGFVKDRVSILTQMSASDIRRTIISRMCPYDVLMRSS